MVEASHEETLRPLDCYGKVVVPLEAKKEIQFFVNLRFFQ